MALTLESFAPLGKDYVEVLRKGYADRWVDFMPNTGKSSGAYSNTVYGVHPYQLTELQRRLRTTCRRSRTSRATRCTRTSRTRSSPTPRRTTRCSWPRWPRRSTRTCCSTTCWTRRRTTARGCSCSASYLDSMRTTLFRQTLFAEFEMKMHEAVERGEPLTGESLNKMYLELLRRVLRARPGRGARWTSCTRAEWAFIPHFYRQLLRLPVRHQHDRRHAAGRRDDRQGRREIRQGDCQSRRPTCA